MRILLTGGQIASLEVMRHGQLQVVVGNKFFTSRFI